MEDKTKQGEYIYVWKKIPQSMISQELGQDANEYLTEIHEILKYYDVYENGAEFSPEGSNGDY
jgi:predicted transcriptional regulator